MPTGQSLHRVTQGTKCLASSQGMDVPWPKLFQFVSFEVHRSSGSWWAGTFVTKSISNISSSLEGSRPLVNVYTGLHRKTKLLASSQELEHGFQPLA